MNWSAEQRRLLDALGYEVLAHGRAMPVAAIPVGGAVPSPRAARPAPTGASASHPTVATPATRATAAGASTSRLLEALRRAADGVDPTSLVGDLDALRRDPARKRALWPRLRALRRKAP